jgi:hypothetical protein
LSQNRFNCIVIFDSIPSGELNTARRLYEDIQVYVAAYSKTPGVKYLRIENESLLFDYLGQLVIQVEKKDVFPLLHFECHGYNDGLQLANGALISWSWLKEALIPLNVAMGLNLMVVFASCFGGSFTKALQVTDRAPVWGLIGPIQEVSCGQLEKHFGTYYRTLFSSGSPKDAIGALNQVSDSNTYWMTNAVWYFYEVWKSYKNKLCTPHMLKERARKMRKQAKREKKQPLLKVSEFKNILTKSDLDMFVKYRDLYFMNDLFSENQNRFQVTYEKAEEYRIANH